MHEDDFLTDAEQKPKRGLPEWGVALLICALLLLTAGLMAYYYLARPSGEAMATATPKPPAATPVLDDAGEPLLLHAYFLDVGNGSCFFARAADGTTLLVDAGGAETAETVTAFLEAQQVERLDAVFVTLAEDAHMGGMAAIAERFPITACYMTADCFVAPECEELLAVLEERHVPVTQVQASFVSVIDWAENVELRILSPYDVRYASTEDGSLMLRIKYGGSAILLASDAHKLAERMTVKALPNHLLHADVLGVGDHGGKEATSEKFLGAVKPRIAVVSCDGSKGAPSRTVLERLETRGVTVLRTDACGTVHITLDGAVAKVVE